MSLNMFWFLPTHGDGHYLGTEEGSRPVDHGYLQQIAQAADRLGYTGVLIPTGRSCEDAWLVAASMILRSLRESTNMPRLASTVLCFRAIRIWKKRIGLASCCSRFWMSPSRKFPSRSR